MQHGQYQETAWIPGTGDNCFYTYCLWVLGKYRGRGYAVLFIEYCLNDTKEECQYFYCAFSVILNVNSVIHTMIMIKIKRYTGSIAKLIKLPRNPNRGGMNVVPT